MAFRAPSRLSAPSGIRPGGLLLLAFACSLLLAELPAVDLSLSRLFFDGTGFYLKNSWWVTWLQECVGCFIGLGLAAVVGLFAFNRLSGRRVRGVDGRVVAYVLLALLLGTGLIVNGVLKHGFGRARPRNVLEFGGDQRFSPAFVLSEACTTNCSFPSGDAAGAFFALPLAYALFRRRRALLAAAAFGGLVSFSRIASGAHFFSDTVVSFFVMWIVADTLHAHMLRTAPGAARPPEVAARETGAAPVDAPAALESPPLPALSTVRE